MKSKEIVGRINEVSNRTALANSDYDFLATHMPFKKLSYSSAGNSQRAKEELTEEDFLKNHIYQSRDDHKMVFIKGNSGSGKSHLIRWFYDKYKNKVDEKEELIILISRDSNSLKGTLNQIVGSDLFKGFREEAEFKKIIEAGKFLEEEKLKEDIPALLAAAVRTTTIRDIEKRERNKLANFLSADIIREKVLFRKGGPISRIITSMIGSKDEENSKSEKSFLKEDFDIVDTKILRQMRDTEGDMGASTRAIAYAEDIERSEEKKQEVSDILNDLVDEVIKKIIGLGRSDLQDVFKKIRSKLKQENMNLTIFFEDITTTTGIHKELLESLIVDHKEVKEDLCRIISFVGITESYYSSQIQANIRGRITHSLDIEDSSLIENREDLSKFIGLYMNAINQPKEKIKDWYLAKSENYNLPISQLNKEKKWSVIEIDKDREISIYPFTSDALWNIYQASDSEGKEPRGFLRQIINNIYSNYITSGVDYLLDMDAYYNTQIPKLKNPLDEERIKKLSNDDEKIKEQTETLIRLWGNGSLEHRLDNGIKTIGNIDEEVFKHFNLPIVPGKTISKPVIEAKPENKPQTPVIIVEEPPTRAMKEYNAAISELDDWRKGGDLIDHKKYRNHMMELYKNFINWEEEGISKYLLETLLTSSVLNIEGQIVDSSKGVVFKRDDEIYYVLVGILNWEYMGERSWDFQDSHKYILRITQYLNKYKKSVMELLERPKGENWELEDILLINSYYFNMLNRTLEESLSIEDLYATIFSTSESIISDSFRELDEKWIILTNIYNRSDEMKFNQELLIKYFNLPLGVASSKATGNVEVYAYKIIQRIKDLKVSNWDVSCYEFKEEKTTDIYRPLMFFKREVSSKIPVLVRDISGNIQSLVKNLESKYKNQIGEAKIRSMSKNINIYLDIIVETGFINNKHEYDSIIYDTDEKEIYSIYNKFKDYNKLTDIDKLRYISKNEIEKLYEYYKHLIILESKIEKYNENCDANTHVGSDELISYKEIKEEIKKNESEITLEIERYLR